MGEEGGEEGAPGDFPLCVQSWELAPSSATEKRRVRRVGGTVRRSERGTPPPSLLARFWEALSRGSLPESLRGRWWGDLDAAPRRAGLGSGCAWAAHRRGEAPSHYWHAWVVGSCALASLSAAALLPQFLGLGREEKSPAEWRGESDCC